MVRGRLYTGHRILPRVYADAAKRMPERFRNAEAFSPNWGNEFEYALQKRIGHGRFGEVYKGVHLPSNRACSVKVVKPVGKIVLQRLRRENGLLQAVNGHPLVADLTDIIFHRSTSTPALVFPWIDNFDRKDLFAIMDTPLLKYYMFRLFGALDFVHSRGIMHRDVKPGNILLDPRTLRFRLIDFGLADFFIPGVERNTKISTRPFKAPELQLEVTHYHYAVDLWAAGCTLASMLFDRYPFFYERGDAKRKTDPLIRHCEILGTDALETYMKKFGLRFSAEQFEGIGHKRPALPLDQFATPSRRDMLDDDVLDLVSKLLDYDHDRRITASEALQHAWFDDVREDLADITAIPQWVMKYADPDLLADARRRLELEK